MDIVGSISGIGGSSSSGSILWSFTMFMTAISFQSQWYFLSMGIFAAHSKDWMSLLNARNSNDTAMENAFHHGWNVL